MTYDSRPDTYTHILKVQRYLGWAITQLLDRLTLHDASKVLPPEVEAFDIYTPRLAETTYGSPEYKADLEAMGPALAHHYAANSHHPEHYDDSIRGMSLLDLLEMLCDWKAATERHVKQASEKEPPIARSIRMNQERFGYSDDLRDILINTARELGMLEPPQSKTPLRTPH